MCWGHEALTEQAGGGIGCATVTQVSGSPWCCQGCHDKRLTPVEGGLVLAGGGSCVPLARAWRSTTARAKGLSGPFPGFVG